jgi:hypothetical protein
MKLSSLAWVLLGLAVIVLIGYFLNRGIYVGSTIDISMREGEGKPLYSKNCRYMYLDGMHNISKFSLESPSRDVAEATPCALLGSSN